MVSHEEEVVTIDYVPRMWNGRAVAKNAAFQAALPDCL
jgi:hypothetical protein